MSFSEVSSAGDPLRNQSAKEVLVHRLQEAEVTLRRAIDLPDGGKANDHDHTDPANQCRPGEVAGNYGILGGKGLVVVDIDSHSGSFDGVPMEIQTLPSTLTVQSPHGGEHRYYAVDGDVRGTNLDGVDVQGTGRYVLGPGSVLDQCSKESHDCSAEGEGAYEILRDRPIAEVRPDDLPEPSSTPGSDSSTTSQEVHGDLQRTEDLRVAILEVETPYNPLIVFDRLTSAETKHGRRNLALIQGEYSKAGYSDDRSKAESALVEELGWWFADDKETVWKLMEKICHLNPQTDTGNRRKWLERGQKYRQSLFDNDWFGDRRTYKPRLMRDTRNRPEVSWLTKDFLIDVLRDLDVARSIEIKDHPDMDRGRRQVQRALNQLTDEGLVESSQQGRHVYYYVAGREDLLAARVGE
jgi:hypothetical protein